MKDLPPRVLSGGSNSAPSNMVAGMKDIGVLGTSNSVKNNPKKGALDKETGAKSTDMWHEDPNTKLIPPA